MGMRCKPIKYCTLAVSLALLAVQADPLQAEPTSSDRSFANSAAVSQSSNSEAFNPGQSKVLQDLYAGVVVNQTITMVGQDFYQNFVAAWRDKPLSERYTLSVYERPSARLGSQIWVEYANRRVFQTFLPPTRARTKEAGLDPVEAAYQNIVDADVVNLFFRDPDLGPDELKN